MKLDYKQCDSVLGQRLPRLYEIHLGLDEIKILDVGVGLQGFGAAFVLAALLYEPVRHVLLDVDVQRVGVDGGQGGGLLHRQERPDAGDFLQVAHVGEVL